jgi:oxygen-dependent protoporphyrinogen oxidase
LNSKGPSDETVADFIIRRLGREALEKLIDPMCSGIYAGDPYNMSINNCFPRIKELEQEYGSLFKALFKIKKQKKQQMKEKGETVSVAPAGTLTSFYNGAQVITDTLAERLGDRVRLGVEIKGITKSNGTYKVDASGTGEDADVVVLASPAYATSQIVKELDKELSEMLNRIPYPHVSVVCFGYGKEKVRHQLDGFGFLVPKVEGRKILGTLWDSSIFPNRASEGNVLLRTMVGGAKFPEMAEQEDSKIIEIVYDELKQILGLSSEPEMARIYRWQKAIPQYLLGHTSVLNSIDEKLAQYPGLYLTGNSYRGIGINDCVENSYRLAEEIIKSLES